MKKTNKTVLIIILALVGVVAIGLAAWFLIANQPPSHTQKPIPTSAKAVIEQLRDTTTISGLDTDFTISNANNGTFYYQPTPDKTDAYSIETTVPYGVTYTAKKQDQTDNSSDTRLVILNYFAGIGFKHVVDQTTYNYQPNIYDTYKKGSILCQSDILTTNPYEKQTYRFTCGDEKALAAIYTDVDSFVTLYKKSASLNTFGVASLKKATKGDVSYAVLYIGNIFVSEGRETTSTLLFAAVKNDWEYIGALSPAKRTGTATAQYDISNVRAKITAAKYGDFIVDSLEKI